MTSNEFYQVRINTVNNFITKFEKEYDDRFSAAICGSLVLGYPHKNSDVDLFLVIPSYNLRKVTSTDIFQNIFKSMMKLLHYFFRKKKHV